MHVWQRESGSHAKSNQLVGEIVGRYRRPFYHCFHHNFLFTKRQHALLWKMMELCQTPTPTFDNRSSPTLLSPPPPPLAAAYNMLVVYDSNCPPFLPAISKQDDDELNSLFVNKQVFRPIPTRIRPIVRSEINNYPSHGVGVGVFDNKQVLFRPIPIEQHLRRLSFSSLSS